MEIITDLHIHSKYSRAVSKQMEIPTIDEWARLKGIKVMGTSDFTHPGWFDHLNETLAPAEPGLYKLKSKDSPTRFLLSTELSCIYKKNEKSRRIHIVVLEKSLESVKKINAALNTRFNLKSDGRPILGIDVKELAKIILEIDPDSIIIPAHVWTPWFSLFGSESGFDSFEECFEELSDRIPAIETGLSSDPKMNWRLSQLDNKAIVSFSDAHSPANLGREATVFDLKKLSYQNIAEALFQKSSQNSIAYTIEFFPEEGKYHWDGHRTCNITFGPKETLKHKCICPKCGKPLTVGVMHRVEKLADRDDASRPKNRPPFKSIVPLQEIIAEAKDVGKGSKSVQTEYHNLTSQIDEFTLLLKTPYSEIEKMTLPKIVEGIKRTREGRVNIQPGYDGVFGVISLFTEKEKEKAVTGQASLF